MTSIIVRAKYIITDAEKKEDGILTDQAVYVSGGKVQEIGEDKFLKDKYPEAEMIGDGSQLLMPGLIDAHSHGAGLSYFQLGIPYDFLENNFFDWSYGYLPDPELHAMLSAINHLRNGCTTVNYLMGGSIERTEKLIRGFQQAGIRLMFTYSGSDSNRLALDNTNFFKTLPEELQEFARPFVFDDKKAIREQYFSNFDDLYSRYHCDHTRIQFGPGLATLCTDEFLQQVKQRADELGKAQIHIHTLQTPIQKAYASRTFGKSQIDHFEDIAFLDENLTLGHAVFVTRSDIEKLAKYGVSTTHHPNCNFVMRNGISPVYDLKNAGVNVAIGIDDKGFNDDEDPFMELRLAHRLHRVSGFDLRNTPMLDGFDILQMGLTNAAYVSGYHQEIGEIKLGMNADMILVDLEKMINDPWISPELNIAEVLIHRAKGRDVDTVIVGGKVLIEDREFVDFDIEGLYAEIREQMNRGLDPEDRKFADNYVKLKPYCQRWYSDWYGEDLDPFYTLNSSI